MFVYLMKDSYTLTDKRVKSKPYFTVCLPQVTRNSSLLKVYYGKSIEHLRTTVKHG